MTDDKAVPIPRPTECKSPIGITTGLLDALMTIAAVASVRIKKYETDQIPEQIGEACSDLFWDKNLRFLISFGGNRDYGPPPSMMELIQRTVKAESDLAASEHNLSLERAVRNELGQEGTMEITVQRRILTVEQIFEKLGAIHTEVQDKFHDQWDWMNAAFYVEALRAQFAALDWQEITPENLPKVGDEVGGWFGVFNPEWEVRPFKWPTPSSQSLKPEIIHDGCKVAGWTHFRPINAPRLTKGGQA